MDPAKLAMAEQRVTWAAKRWGRCLETNTFLGYRKDVYWAAPKPWEDGEAAERQAAVES
jgi:hypothetical protein